jgi:flagellar protein FlaJ
MYFDKKLKHLTYLSSAILSIIFLLLIFYLGLFNPEPPYWIPLSVDVNNVIVCSIILVLLPPAIIEFLNSRWLDGVEKNVHRLLQDVTEEVKSGEPLINALEVSASADYGPLSPLLRESLVRFNLTSNFRDAMNWFGVNLVKPVGSQMASILLESYETGGEITDVLISSVKLFKTIEDDRLHRKSQTRPYLFVIYTGLLIFILISYVLLNQFLIHFQFTTEVSGLTQAGISLASINLDYYASILYWAAIIESLVGGIVVGKMTEGKVSAGLIHSILMIVITLLLYNFLI